MSVSRKLDLALGLEDDAPNVQVNIDTDEAGAPLDDYTPEGEPTPEADETELNVDAEDISDDGESFDDLQDASAALESIYLSMESAQRDGGLTREAAVFAGHAVNGALARFNITHEEVGISLESFGENKARATTVSMEGIKEVLASIWKKIVSIFQTMMKKIADFWTKHVGAAARLKKRAEALQAKARILNGKPKDAKIKAGLFRQLNVNGRIEADLGNKLPAYIDSVSGVFDKNATETEINKFAESLFSSAVAADPVADINSKLQSAAAEVAKAFGATNKSKVTINGNEVTVSTSAGLPGNKIIVCDVIAGADPAKDVSEFVFGIRDQKANLKAPDKVNEIEFKALNIAECEKICDAVSKAMSGVIRQKTQPTKKLNTVKVVQKKGEEFVAKVTKDNAEDSAKQAAATKVMNSVIKFAKTSEEGEAQVLKYNYELCKASLAYVARSLSNYSTAEEKTQ